MRRVMVLWALASCYSPNAPEGAPCSSDEGCPGSQRCIFGMCSSHGTGDASITDAEVDSPLPSDADPNCHCTGSTLTCPTSTTTCTLGCTIAGDRCIQLVPSNNVNPLQVNDVSVDIAISGIATFNGDTGQITGSLVRAPGAGVIAGIDYQQQSSGGVTAGVFTFHKLTINGGATVHLLGGARAMVFLVGTTATIAGKIDGSAGCQGTDLMCRGPGGGNGALWTATPGGCGPGGAGMQSATTSDDSGGGGGGGGTLGARGGNVVNAAVTPPVNEPGGAGGAACIPASLEPLLGGSGGGGGSPGSGVPTSGGGGGGAFQLTANDSILVGATGVIVMSGGGGEGGPANVGPKGGGAGAGGGAGSSILLESPSVIIGGVLAANGGGGGCSGHQTLTGADGASGTADAVPAPGGVAAAATQHAGGAGGARGVGPKTGEDLAGNGNGGGGGGAVGRIFMRVNGAPTLQGTSTISPAQTNGLVRTN